MRFLLLSLLLLGIVFCQTSAQSIWEPDTAARVRMRLPFNEARVIDNRPNKDNIGFLKTGALNKYSELVTVHSLDTTLIDYIGRLLAAGEYKAKLLAIIHDFRTEDQDRGDMVGTCYLHADLFVSYRDGYRHLRELDTFYETTSNRDVTKLVLHLPSTAITDMVRAAATSAAAAAPVRPIIYSAADAQARMDSVRLSLPLYTVTEYPRGLYASCWDLLHLRPQATEFIDTHEWSSTQPVTIHFYYKNARGKKGKEIPPDSCYAISDGRRLYLSTPGYYTKLVKQGDHFYANLFLDGKVNNGGAVTIVPMLTSGVMFGAIGGLMVGVAVGSGGQRFQTSVLYKCRVSPGYARMVIEQRIRSY